MHVNCVLITIELETVVDFDCALTDGVVIGSVCVDGMPRRCGRS